MLPGEHRPPLHRTDTLDYVICIAGEMGMMIQGGWAQGVLLNAGYKLDDFIIAPGPTDNGKPVFVLNADAFIFWQRKEAGRGFALGLSTILIPAGPLIALTLGNWLPGLPLIALALLLIRGLRGTAARAWLTEQNSRAAAWSTLHEEQWERL